MLNRCSSLYHPLGIADSVKTIIFLKIKINLRDHFHDRRDFQIDDALFHPHDHLDHLCRGSNYELMLADEVGVDHLLLGRRHSYLVLQIKLQNNENVNIYVIQGKFTSMILDLYFVNKSDTYLLLVSRNE
jgi:hypothetical protein